MEITSFKIFAQDKRMFLCSGHHLFDVQLSTDYTCRFKIALFIAFLPYDILIQYCSDLDRLRPKMNIMCSSVSKPRIIIRTATK